ncbi:MAG: M48 family metallopeptidase [Paracoccaceae bacterium]
MEPTAEGLCRQYSRGLNCDFKIVVDTRRNQPPNAYQSLEEGGRPVITFTEALIFDARNTDELAFVMGHEAAHHIQNHLTRQAQNAAAGAAVFAGLASLTGGSTADIATAQELGEFVGSRSYSKEFELEADELGTLITKRAGYDPLVGAQFFNRIPDPGNQFLGTHPPNADRYQAVVNTLARIGG